MNVEPQQPAQAATPPDQDDGQVVNPRGPGRREIMRTRRESARRSKPYLIVGALILAGLAALLGFGFVQKYVLPPRQTAVRVDQVEYSRGEVVDFIRFNQRLAEDRGIEFQVGNSLFDALQIIQDNELAFKAAPTLGVTISPDELDARIEELLGFPQLTPEERADPRLRQSVEEAKRQFLNRVGLAEDVYREIVRKDLFKKKVREVLSQNVPRIQPQVRVYEIVLTENSAQTLQRLDRAIRGGDTPEQVVMEFSADPNKQRNRGEVGWLPRNVVKEIDDLLWGTAPDGTRTLPFGTPSEPRYNADGKTYNVYIVTEYAEAREVDEASFQKLADAALEEFLAERRRELSARNGLWMALDDKIYNWVNRQVRLASLLPTPTPQQNVLSQFAQ